MDGPGVDGSTTFGPFDYPAVPDSTTQTASITITAVDGAGNSASSTLSVSVRSASLCFG